MNYGTIRWVNANPQHSEASPVHEIPVEPAEYATMAWLRVDAAYTEAGEPQIPYANGRPIPEPTPEPLPIPVKPNKPSKPKRWGKKSNG